MEDLSEEKIKTFCPHCDPGSFALRHLIKQTPGFWIVCDVHPLCEGHLLILPKAHLSCVGEYPPDLLEEFLTLYAEYSSQVRKIYGSVASFEHGKIGQTVFHSHVHILPFSGSEEHIIPEGKNKLSKLSSLSELHELYANIGRYLFFSVKGRLWTVDTGLGAVRFFRDRFASALGHFERGDWKAMHNNRTLMTQAEKEIASFKRKLSILKTKHVK